MSIKETKEYACKTPITQFGRWRGTAVIGSSNRVHLAISGGSPPTVFLFSSLIANIFFT